MSNAMPLVELHTDVAVASALGQPASGIALHVCAHHTHVKKAAHGYKGINRKRRFVQGQTVRMKFALLQFFKDQRADISKELVDILTKSNEDLVARALDNLNLDAWVAELPKLMEQYLVAVAVDGGETAAEAMGIFSSDVLALMRNDATAWGEARSAEMVGMKLVDGEMVANPNARWVITESTRDLLRSDIVAAMNEGASPADLADIIEGNYAMSASRASMIARTEMANADVAGSMIQFRTAGATGKEWLLAENPCAICEANEAQGMIPIDSEFSSGDDAPPAHPNCECDVVPTFDNSGDEQ